MSIDEAELHFVMASYSVTHHFIIVHLYINFLYFFWKVRTEHHSAFEYEFKIYHWRYQYKVMLLI